MIAARQYQYLGLRHQSCLMPEQPHKSTHTLFFDNFTSSDSARALDAIRESVKTDYNSLAEVTEIYDAIPASVIIVDARMRLVGWNRFSRDTINGLSDSEMTGVNPLKRVHPDDFDEISRKVLGIIHRDAEESAEFRMYHKNGPPYKWAMFRGKRAIIGGEPCMVAVVTEITELKRAEEQRNKLQEQLLQYQKMEMVGQLAGGIAHDFNNALTAIIGMTELARKRLDPASPAARNIDDIHQLASRSAEMTRKLFAFARKQVATPKVFELNKAVSECLRLHRSLIGESIHIDWHPHANPLQVKLDPVQLDQILSNLLVNARDAIDGNGAIQIESESVRLDMADCVNRRSGFTPGKYAKISVSDTGGGIDEKILPHIYEPFFTTKEIDKGTGLGLSTVYGIVMQNNGHIECHTKPGKGATFTIYLPLHHEDGQANSEVIPTETIATAIAPSAKETIVVVDDEPYILKLIEDILESRDFNVLTAKDAGECLKITECCTKPVDLVVADVVLPDMTCMEMSRLLRLKNPSLKLLFMSAHAPETINRCWTEDDEANFIQKPFGVNDFIEAVNQTLNMA
jgi:two-component system, cell cycle sensor histidine kinase and response regulator CckA